MRIWDGTQPRALLLDAVLALVRSLRRRAGSTKVYKHRGRSLVSAWPMVQGAPAPVFTSKSQHDKGNLNFHVEVKSRNLDF